MSALQFCNAGPKRGIHLPALYEISCRANRTAFSTERSIGHDKPNQISAGAFKEVAAALVHAELPLLVGCSSPN